MSPFLSGPVWTEDQISILSEVSPEYAEHMRIYADEGYVGPEAMELLGELFERSLFMHEENRSKAKGMARIPTGEVCLRLWGRNDGIPIGPLRDFDITSRLRDVGVPTLIMYGSRDQITKRSAESFRDAIARSELLEVDGAGHYTLREEPRIYADAIHRFTGRSRQFHVSVDPLTMAWRHPCQRLNDSHGYLIQSASYVPSRYLR